MVNAGNLESMRFIFEDHEGEPNHVDFELLQTLLVDEADDSGDSERRESKCMFINE